MNQIGKSDAIHLGERTFLIETTLTEDRRSVVSQISENTHELLSFRYPMTENLPIEQLETSLDERHQAILADWELLFYIHGKVKKSLHAPSLNSLGLILMQRKLLPEAIDCFTEAIVQENRFTEAYLNLSKVYLQAELYEEAVESLTKVLEFAPEYADLHYYLGVAYLGQHEYQKAVSWLEKAIQSNANYSDAHYQLGLTYLISIVRSGDSGEMIPVSLRQKKILTHLQKALDLNHAFDQPNVRQALKEIQDGKYKNALYLLETIELKQHKEQENHFAEEFYLHFMFGGKGKDDKIIAEYMQQLQDKLLIKSNYPDLHNNLGIAYLIQCRNMFLKAMEQFRLALKINPAYKLAQRNLKLAENEGKGFIILLRALLK